MLFRRHTRNAYSKLHLRLRGIQRVFGRWHDVNLPNGSIRQFISPQIKGLDWRVLTSQGEDVDRWVRDQARGSVIVRSTPTDSNVLLPQLTQPCRIQVSFTDLDSALLFKLQLGGRA